VTLQRLSQDVLCPVHAAPSANQMHQSISFYYYYCQLRFQLLPVCNYYCSLYSIVLYFIIFYSSLFLSSAVVQLSKGRFTNPTDSLIVINIIITISGKTEGLLLRVMLSRNCYGGIIQVGEMIDVVVLVEVGSVIIKLEPSSTLVGT